MYNGLVKFNTGITKVYNVIMMILLGLMVFGRSLRSFSGRPA